MRSEVTLLYGDVGGCEGIALSENCTGHTCVRETWVLAQCVAFLDMLIVVETTYSMLIHPRQYGRIRAAPCTDGVSADARTLSEKMCRGGGMCRQYGTGFVLETFDEQGRMREEVCPLPRAGADSE